MEGESSFRGVAAPGVHRGVGDEGLRVAEENAAVCLEARGRSVNGNAFMRDRFDVAAILTGSAIETDERLVVCLARFLRGNAGMKPFRPSPDRSQPNPITIAEIGAEDRLVRPFMAKRGSQKEAQSHERSVRVERPDPAHEVTTLIAWKHDL